MNERTISVKEVLLHASFDIVYEVILTIKIRDGVVNAAPIELKFLDGAFMFSLIPSWKHM